MQSGAQSRWARAHWLAHTKSRKWLPRDVRWMLRESLPGPFLPPEDVATVEALFRALSTAHRARPVERRCCRAGRRRKRRSAARRNSRRSYRGGRVAVARPFHSVPPRWLKAHSTGLHREEFPTCLRRADQILREAPPQMPCSPGSDPGRPLRKLADRDRKEDATGQVGRSPACIVSSHSDLFVTRDEGLESALAEIKPGPRVVRVAEFATLLS